MAITDFALDFVDSYCYSSQKTTELGLKYKMYKLLQNKAP